MDTKLLKLFFPCSFTEKKDVMSLVIMLLIHVGAGAVIGTVTGLLAHIPLVGIIVGIIGGVLGFYVLAGIVFTVLDYLKIL